MHCPQDKSVGILFARDASNFTSPEYAPVKLVDGYGFVTMPVAKDIPWPTDYPSVHMVVEDMCMRIREQGLGIWTLDSSTYHKSQGTVDEAYWASVDIFHERWRRQMEGGVSTPEKLRREFEKYQSSL
jgi:hypothetical protein